MDALWCLLVIAGTWYWVVKQRGEWNLFLANLAGLGSGLVVGMVFTLVYDGLFGTTMATPNLARSLQVLMTSGGVLAGIWMWVANRGEPQHPVARQLLGALCGFAGGATALVLLAMIY
ncbi:hypothetical protein [Pseudomonas atagonensis]|uniref:hypothetical protein n=1 Tax=Pseudomonas atagonensis TaxID=2609964 RepID=UPI00140D16A5|nr:hypothetical protein [Pseudomonas atagonensis]